MQRIAHHHSPLSSAVILSEDALNKARPSRRTCCCLSSRAQRGICFSPVILSGEPALSVVEWGGLAAGVEGPLFSRRSLGLVITRSLWRPRDLLSFLPFLPTAY